MVESGRNFQEAVTDLLHLLNRGYPKKPSVELVGNRYRLNTDERMMLYRGVYDEVTCRERIKKKTDLKTAQENKLAVDGYNVLITLESYLEGKTVFLSLDGYVRDVAGTYGNLTFGEENIRCAEVFIKFAVTFLRPPLSTVSPPYQPLFIYLDYPVSRSGELATYLRKRFEEEGLRVEVDVVKSPDSIIVEHHRDDIVSTSDTALIDRVERCFDIPEAVIQKMFNKRLPEIGCISK